jgi:hypothetical protein
MMLYLVLDVLQDMVQLGHTDTEGAIFFLPPEEALLRKGFMHPFRRAALDKL